MIRSLYQELDTQLQDFQAKFQHDEIALRARIDEEIKKQMSHKLEELELTQTANYGNDFLDVIGKNTAYGKLDYFDKNLINRLQHLFLEKNKSVSKTQVHLLPAFFYNLVLLNEDKNLKDDEYIIGVYGYVSNNQYGNSNTMTIHKLIVISNYYNTYEVIIQYNSQPENLNKKFQERYNLKPLQKNDMLLYDSQIDLVSSIFQKIILEFTGLHQENSIKSFAYTKYYYEQYRIFMLEEKKQEYYDYSSSFNFNSLRENCLTETGQELDESMLKCCRKCYMKYQNHILTPWEQEKQNLSQKLSQEQHRIQCLGPQYQEFHIEEKIFSYLESQFNDFWADKISPITDLTPQVLELEKKCELWEAKHKKIENDLLDKIEMLASKEQDIIAQSKIIKEKSGKLKKNKEILTRKDEHTQSLAKDLLDKIQMLESKEHDIQLQNETIKAGEVKLRECQEVLTKQEANIQSLEKELENKDKEIQKMVLKFQEKRDSVNQLELDLKSLESSLQKSNQQVSTLTDLVEEKNKKNYKLEILVKDLRFQKQQIIKQIDSQPSFMVFGIVLLIFIPLLVYLL